MHKVKAHEAITLSLFIAKIRKCKDKKCIYVLIGSVMALSSLFAGLLETLGTLDLGDLLLAFAFVTRAAIGPVVKV